MVFYFYLKKKKKKPTKNTTLKENICNIIIIYLHPSVTFGKLLSASTYLKTSCRYFLTVSGTKPRCRSSEYLRSTQQHLLFQIFDHPSHFQRSEQNPQSQFRFTEMSSPSTQKINKASI